MEKYLLKRELKVFGEQVTTFPYGIAETFEKLMKMLGGFNRSFYGISYMDPTGKIVYYATALEINEDEAEKYNCNRLIIEKGEYLTQKIDEWKDKTDCIKDVFTALIKEGCPPKERPAIEWYKNEHELFCMIKAA